MRAGVIGLGHIGGGVALWLSQAGLLSAIYDVRPDATAKLDGLPELSASPADVAQQSDVVIIAVVSAVQTISALSGPQGVLAAARPDLSIVLLATVSLLDLEEIRTLTDSAGVLLIDCGVAGGPSVYKNRLVCLVGAEEDQLAKVKPVLDGFSKAVLRMGPPGAGMAAKIALNVVSIGCLRAGYEGALLAEAAGIDVHQLAYAIRASEDGVRGPMMMVDRPGNPGTDPVEARARNDIRHMMGKDLDAALALARTLGVELPLSELTRNTDYEVTGALRTG